VCGEGVAMAPELNRFVDMDVDLDLAATNIRFETGERTARCTTHSVLSRE